MSVDLTYSEVGRTSGVLPAGYRHIRRSAVIGRGPDDFHRACVALLTWDMHRRAGLNIVTSHERAELGADVRIGLRLGPFRFTAPCRVVAVIDKADAQGFAYGTLPGHPECGEEAFIVRLSEDGVVRLDVTAFSRPARWFSRVAAPAARIVQARITTRYLSALRTTSR